MKFTPKSDEQFKALEEERKAQWQPWPAGSIVDYEILHCVAATSSKGNEMLKTDVRLFNDEGKQKDITIYLGDWNEYMLKRICEAGGIAERYEAGQVDDYDLIGKTGKCKLKIEKGAEKPDGSFYADKNAIAEVLKPDSESKKVDADLDDQIPF